MDSDLCFLQNNLFAFCKPTTFATGLLWNKIPFRFCLVHWWFPAVPLQLHPARCREADLCGWPGSSILHLAFSWISSMGGTDRSQESEGLRLGSLPVLFSFCSLHPLPQATAPFWKPCLCNTFCGSCTIPILRPFRS